MKYPYDYDYFLHIVKDNAKTKLTQNIDAVQTSIPVESTEKFPESGIIRIGDELIKYTSKTPTSFKGCVRGYGGTEATSHSANSLVWLPILGEHHNLLRDSIIRIEKFIGLKPDDWDDNITIVSKLNTLEMSLKNFNLNAVMNHINNTNNPHKVTLEQVRKEDNKILGPIDFNNNEALNLVLEKNQSVLNPVEGRVYYHTVYKHIYVFDGNKWKKILFENDLEPIKNDIINLKNDVQNIEEDVNDLKDTLINFKLKDIKDVPDYKEGRVLGIVNGKPRWISIDLHYNDNSGNSVCKGKVKVNVEDTPDYLINKIINGDYTTIQIINDDNEKKLKIDVSVDDLKVGNNLWTSQKISSELEKKINKPTTFNNEDIVIFDSNGGVKDSGKKITDFAPAQHTHNISDISQFPPLNGNAKKFVIVNETEDGFSYVDIQIADEKVKTDFNDDKPGYLIDKIDGITLEVDTTNHKLKVKDGVFAPAHHKHTWDDLIIDKEIWLDGGVF